VDTTKQQHLHVVLEGRITYRLDMFDPVANSCNYNAHARQHRPIFLMPIFALNARAEEIYTVDNPFLHFSE